MGHNKESQFAILRIDTELSFPTEIARIKPIEINKPLDYRAFIYGTQVEEYGEGVELKIEQKRAFKRFRFFKNDLSLSLDDLNVSLLTNTFNATEETREKIKEENANRKKKIKWSMQPLRGSSVKPYLIPKAQSSQIKKIFNPKDAAEIFFAKLLHDALSKVDDHFPEVEQVSVHVSIPAYENSKSSENFRENLEKVVKEITSKGIASETDFKIKGGGDFLYEPYGVFYYYAAIEGLVDFENAKGLTYLVFDMGGSTTDLALIQINSKGNHSTSYPIARSIQSAGSDFDEYILDYLISRNSLDALKNSEEADDALRGIERAKISLADKNDPSDLCIIQIAGQEIEFSYNQLEKVVENWWEKQDNPIRNGLKSFLDKAIEVSKSNPLLLEFSSLEKVFMAGGSTNLPGLVKLLEIEIAKYFKPIESKPEFVKSKIAPTDSITSLGLAFEVSLRSGLGEDNLVQTPLLNRAEKVFGRIVTAKGDLLPFRHRKIETGIPGEFLVYDRLQQYEDSDFERKAYHETECSKEDLGTDLAFHLRTNLETIDEGYQKGDEERIPLDIKKIARFDEEILSLGFSHNAFKVKDSSENGLELHGKPYIFRYNPHMKKKDYSEGGYERIDVRKRGAMSIKLTPPKIASKGQHVHLCIDFGMSNTSVSVYSQGVSIPNHSDFQKIELHITQKRELPINEIPEPIDDSAQEVGPKKMDSEGVSSEIDRGGLVMSMNDMLWMKRMAFQNASLTKEIGSVLKEISSTLKRISPFEKTNKPIDPDSQAKGWATNWVVNNEEVDYSSEEFSFPAFLQFIERKGYQYESKTLKMVWAQSRNTKSNLVILAGPPGTGKTSLVRLVAQFFNQIEGDENPFQKIISVSPTWFSPASLHGSYSEIDQKFHGTPFLDFVLLANIFFAVQAKSEIRYSRKFFLCLDEFNLAHPEQYFANILSAMELPYDDADSSIIVCSKAHLGMDFDLSFKISPNLKIFATVNTDAAAKQLSGKILDRSIFHSIIPSRASIDIFVEKKVEEIKSEIRGLDEVLRFFMSHKAGKPSVLDQVFKLAKLANVPMGYRVLERMKDYILSRPERYMTAENSNLELKPIDRNEILGEIICDLFLVKLPGAFNVEATDYGKYLDDLLEGNNIHALVELPGVRNVLTKLRQGFSGQSAF